MGTAAADLPDVLLVERQGSVAVLAINRPEKLNALNTDVFAALQGALDTLESDSSVKVLIFTGVGDRAFAAGADIAQLAQMDAVQAFEQMTRIHRLFLRISQFPKPTIAMVNGYALGGGFELALSCDMLVASEKAVFGFPEITLDTLPGWGGTQLAPTKMSSNRAREMVLTGRHYSAGECTNFGFINQMVPADRLRPAALELAGVLASRNSFALEMAKSALQQADGQVLAAGMRYEALAYATNFSAPHAKAGLNAFLSRRGKRPKD
jgi:enoyl-CoA hydratase